MNWIQRKIYLYNVTFGLYMLDWWERFLFNTLVVVLMWFVCYNGFRYASDVCNRTCPLVLVAYYKVLIGTLQLQNLQTPLGLAFASEN